MREITLREIRNTLPRLVRDQLPRTIQERAAVRVECDSAMIKVFAVVHVHDQRWRFELQDGVVEGRPAKCRLRDEDISLLCVSV